MNLLYKVIFAADCRSTHHKMALESLLHLRGRNAERWRDLFLKHHEAYLEGAKAPDTTFKDFRNHVLHVSDDYWGGAPRTAKRWYDETVQALRAGDWSTAAYNAGVVSHYYTDPIQPFHTGQSKEENNIHRAAEWSITKSYDAIRELIEARGKWPDVSVPADDDWVEQMVRRGAELGHPHYDSLIDQYDFDAGVKRPQEGWNDKSLKILSALIAHAIIGFARILDRAFEESAAEPPRTMVTLRGYLATVAIPIRWITNKLADIADQQQVEAIYAELQETGTVERHLPEDDRAVRDLHAKEVLGISPTKPSNRRQPADVIEQSSVPIKRTNPPAHAGGSPAPAKPNDQPLRYYLKTSDHVVDAPSIGSKTAKRLKRAGIHTVADLLDCDPDEASAKIRMRHIQPETIRNWQDQSRLVCRVPQLRGHDAQLLVACGFHTPEQVAASKPEDILASVLPFCDTTEGQRITRGSCVPDLAEVQNWVGWADQSRPLRAA